MLDINNVSIEFKKKKVLANITYSFPSYGLYAIVGKSGIGKTTLLNTIIGLLKPTTGNVLFNNEDIHKFSNEKRIEFLNEKIGCVFQNYSLIEELTVEENINLGNSCLLEEVEAMKKYLDIEDIWNQRVKDLSGGERQRTAIARAILKSPDILIADEPTGNLDEENSKNILQYLKEISKNTLVIMVTHDVELAKEYASCLLKLSKNGLEEFSSFQKQDEPIIHASSKNHASLKKLSYKMHKRLLFSGLYGRKNLFFLYSCLLLISLLLSTLSLTILTFDKADLSYRLISEYNSQKGIVEIQKEESYEQKFNLITKGKLFFTVFEKNIIGKKYKLDNYNYIQLNSFDNISLIEGRLPLNHNEVIVSQALAESDVITLRQKEYKVVGVTSLFEDDITDQIIFGNFALNSSTSISTSTPFSIYDTCYYFNAQKKNYLKDIAEDEIVVSSSLARFYNLKEGQTYEVIDKDALNSDYFADQINMFSLMGSTVKIKEILDTPDFFIIVNDMKYKILEEEYYLFYNYDKTVLIHPMSSHFIHQIYDVGFEIQDSILSYFTFGLSFIKVYSFLLTIILILAIILFATISLIYYKNVLLGYQRQACILSYLGFPLKYTFGHHSVLNCFVLIISFFLNWLFTFVITTILNRGVFVDATHTYNDFSFLPVRMDIILYSTLLLGLMLFIYSFLALFHFKKSRIANGLL